MVYDPQALRHLIDTVGVQQVVGGTDYPFDMGSYDLAQLLSRVPGLEASSASKIVSWRDANGPFATRNDVRKVEGLDRKSVV